MAFSEMGILRWRLIGGTTKEGCRVMGDALFSPLPGFFSREPGISICFEEEMADSGHKDMKWKDWMVLKTSCIMGLSPGGIAQHRLMNSQWMVVAISSGGGRGFVPFTSSRRTEASERR